MLRFLQEHTTTVSWKRRAATAIGKEKSKDAPVWTWEVQNDPYDGVEGMRVRARIRDIGGKEGYGFNIRIKVTAMCCGILEFNRPLQNGYSAQMHPAEYYLFLDTIVEAYLLRQACPTEVKWGRQFIASYSTESPAAYLEWLITRGWVEVSAAPNPRTGRTVRLFQRVLTDKKAKVAA